MSAAEIPAGRLSCSASRPPYGSAASSVRIRHPHPEFGFGFGHARTKLTVLSRIVLSYKTFDVDASRSWVVFIHGAGGSSAVWFKQLRAFRERFNLLLVDLRGHGRSHDFHGGGRPYTLDGISEDVMEVMDHLDIERAHFVGVSLGSVLIRTLVEMAPGRIRSVVYAGAVAGFNLWARFLISAGHFLKHIVPFRTLYATFAWIIMPGRHAEEARRVFRREARQVEPTEFKRWMRLTREVNSRIRDWTRQAVTVPSLYVMGALDYIFLPPVRDIVAEQPSARLRVIEGAGHVCNIEAPDAFNEAAIDFIDFADRGWIHPVGPWASTVSSEL